MPWCINPVWGKFVGSFRVLLIHFHTLAYICSQACSVNWESCARYNILGISTLLTRYSTCQKRVYCILDSYPIFLLMIMWCKPNSKIAYLFGCYCDGISGRTYDYKIFMWGLHPSIESDKVWFVPIDLNIINFIKFISYVDSMLKSVFWWSMKHVSSI